MNTVTQTMRFRQSLLNYAEKHGVTKAAIKYNVNRQYIYRWKRRYNGDIQSLANKSHRPHHHPNQHTEEELRQIANFRRRNPRHRACRALGKAAQERLYPLHHRPVSCLASSGTDGCQTAKSQIYSKTLRTDALSGRESAD